ncbi:Chitobiosyldiphosphodolichol beta-mannosyltransferase [Globisporangium polare]
MSVSSMSDINSLDEVESELSFDDEAKVSPIPRRLSHRSAALLTAQATTSTPRRVSTPLRAPSMIRSSPSISRSVTAPAPGTAPVESFDRLKHLKIHMKQLQKLYNQEVHLEELAARDAFLQTMCTSSITLFRHCAYRSRFFIAVKALLCQYLPASNAKLIQVERSSSDNKCYLVLQDSQTFEVTAESDSIGIASSAAHAMLMMEGGDPLSPNLSRSSSSNGSSAASEARTSDDVTYGSAWLNSHADCVLPSASGHLLLLFPVHALYRIGFHQETDLAARKRDGEGAQLLVMGMKSASGYPIGIVEAILPSDSQYNVEFLDALGVLLATALESRLTICRSVVDKLEIQVVDSRSQGGQSRRCGGSSRAG